MNASKPSALPPHAILPEAIEDSERERLIRKLNEELEVGMLDIEQGEIVDSEEFFAELAAELERDKQM